MITVVTDRLVIFTGPMQVAPQHQSVSPDRVRQVLANSGAPSVWIEDEQLRSEVVTALGLQEPLRRNGGVFQCREWMNVLVVSRAPAGAAPAGEAGTLRYDMYQALR